MQWKEDLPHFLVGYGSLSSVGGWIAALVTHREAAFISCRPKKAKKDAMIAPATNLIHSIASFFNPFMVTS
jgi:hypothetical protein